MSVPDFKLTDYVIEDVGTADDRIIFRFTKESPAAAAVVQYELGQPPTVLVQSWAEAAAEAEKEQS